jgi:hypothetical protein
MTRNHSEATVPIGVVKARNIEGAVLSDMNGDPTMQRVWSSVVSTIKQWSAIIVRTI